MRIGVSLYDVADAATATAATSAPATRSAPAVCGWTEPLGSDSYYGLANFWLSYNTCNRDVRGGGEALLADEVVWHLWVWNEDTNVTETMYIDSDDPNQVGNQYTAATSDAGTESHVCIMPYHLFGGGAAGVKSCTGWY